MGAPTMHSAQGAPPAAARRKSLVGKAFESPSRGTCIISAEEAIAIYKARDENRKKRDKLGIRLAAQYGISTKAVRDIWNLRTWSQVTQPYWTTADCRKMERHSCSKNPAIAATETVSEDACDACLAHGEAHLGAAAHSTHNATCASTWLAHEHSGCVDVEHVERSGARWHAVLQEPCSCDSMCIADHGNDDTMMGGVGGSDGASADADAAAHAHAHDHNHNHAHDHAHECLLSARSAAEDLAEWGFSRPAEDGERWCASGADSSMRPMRWARDQSLLPFMDDPHDYGEAHLGAAAHSAHNATCASTWLAHEHSGCVDVEHVEHQAKALLQEKVSALEHELIRKDEELRRRAGKNSLFVSSANFCLLAPEVLQNFRKILKRRHNSGDEQAKNLLFFSFLEFLPARRTSEKFSTRMHIFGGEQGKIL